MDVAVGTTLPFTSSEAMKWALRYPAPPPPALKLVAGEPHAPYATQQAASWRRRLRPTSAPPMRSEYMTNILDHQLGKGIPQRRKADMLDSPGRARTPGFPYSPLHDPHLQDYYHKRFGALLSAAERPHSSGKRWLDANMTPTFRAGSGKARKMGKRGDVVYKIVVTTGKKKNCGTSARVFLRINGGLGRLPKTRLVKRTSEAADARAPYRFAKGSTHIFQMKTQDLGDLKSLVIEHDGKENTDSWFLESVEILNTANQKSWMFLCEKWLSKSKGDLSCRRELMAAKSAKTEYEVVVVTGNKMGAGTDANVYLTLFGKNTKTNKLHLRQANKKCFNRNQSDVFTIKANTIGPMTKLRIEHDNTGVGPGWYLERIVVTDLNNPRWKYYFPCGQWLSKTEGDGCICRDLLGSKNPLSARKSGKYRVTVYTADVRGAGTDANVYITLFGESGESGQKLLSNSYNNFERGRKDEFMVSAPGVGRVRRIRIGHDNSGLSPGWKLDRVIVDDLCSHVVYSFPCERWLARDEDDGQVSRDLVAGLGGVDAAQPGVPYHISVSTADHKLAGTSARVFIVLYGGKAGEENSGKIWLDNGKFSRGKTDIFSVEVATLLSPLSRIDIGHDNSGGGPGWFLDRVVVKCPSAGVEQTFVCNKWLALDEADGVIERTLYETKSLRQEGRKSVTWQVWTYTSDIRGAGTDANVKAVLYGQHPKTREVIKSDSIVLDNKGDNFEQGQCDKFKVDTLDVGIPFKLRISHDNSGRLAGWHLDRVEMEKMGSGQRYVFPCRRWLAKDEDDGSLVREMAADGPGVGPPLPLKTYQVKVKTADKAGAGTDANVLLNMFGELGDSGERILARSKTNKNKFERNQLDVFDIECVTLKKLKKIKIGHDGSRPGAGWYLENVEISEEGSKEEPVKFEVNRWFAVNEDDGAIVREITVGGLQGLATTTYHVSVKTGEIKNAGTDANVHIIIYGENGDTGILPLKRSDAAYNKFERGRTDTFKIESGDFGKIERLLIGHDNFLAAEGWFLDEVQVDVPSKGEFYRFACHRWLDKGEDDGRTEICLLPTEVRSDEKYIPYEITVWTGDKKSAGTDANVFIQLYGERGKTQEVQLRNKTNNFERNQIDRFKIEARPVGHLAKIRIGHDGTGIGSGWLLSKILVQCPKSKKPMMRQRSASLRKRHDDCGKENKPESPYLRRQDSRLSRADLDGRSESPSYMRRRDSRRDLDEVDRAGRAGDTARRGSRSPVSPYNRRHDSADRRHDSIDDSMNTSQSEKEDEFESYWFVCDRWFARSEDDGKIVRELLPTTEDGKRLETGLQEVEYTLFVKTGDVFGAGTDANVFVQITGDLGDSGERKLTKSNNLNKFERNQTDVFKLKAVELGMLHKLKIRHDNKGGGAAWFLDYIEIEEPGRDQRHFFPCQRWLSVTKDDGQVMRELVPVDPGLKSRLAGKDHEAVRKEIGLEQKAALTTYHVHVTTGDVWGAGTDANVHLFLFGDHDDSGKILLKSSKSHKNKFERNQTDEFVVEVANIGELQKIIIGHDDAGGGAAWHLSKVEIDCPSLGRKWTFPCGRWLAKKEADGKLEVELKPQELATEEYAPCIPYEVTTYTSDISGASTDANVYISIYGKEQCTEQKPLCTNKQERKTSFKRGAVDKFILELEDVGEPIEKIRIGHGSEGFGSGWHVDKVTVRRLKAGQDGSTTYTFQCGRWLAKDEDDGATVVELVPDNVVEEKTGKDGLTKRKEMKRRDTLKTKTYQVDVFTGDAKSCGTDANVFITIFGDKGDSGERQLSKSETNRDKFERGRKDVFRVTAADLGKLYKILIRHDNSMLNPDWFLDRVEVRDPMDEDNYVFLCERWLAKKKDDCKIARTLYVKGYDGDMSSTSTLHSARIGSVTSLDSIRSAEPFSKSPRMSRRYSMIEELPEQGPVVPYTVRIYTGDKPDAGTAANCWINLIGPKKKLTTGRLFLKLAQKAGFESGAVDTFSLEAIDVENVEKVELGHDGRLPGSGWFVKQVQVDMPTKGKSYHFQCHSWLAVDKGDGLTTRVFSTDDGSSSVTKYKAKIPYEMTVFTGDVHSAGTDSIIKMTVFGRDGAINELVLAKQESRFERDQADTIKVELDDMEPLKRLRVQNDGSGSRPDWYLEKVNFRNTVSGDMTVFLCQAWLSADRDDKKLVRDLPATVKGVTQIKRTDYRIQVKTTERRGAGTSANVFITVFGENGDTGQVQLKNTTNNKSPFQTGQTDIFQVKDCFSLGELTKCRIWHDNKGFTPAWHLSVIEVTDEKTGKTFVFPCDKWLSRADDDKQIYRELTCSKPHGHSGTTSFEIKVTTSDKTNAGMVHNGWLILEGEKRQSKVFVMENGAKNKVLRKGQTDTFKMISAKPLGPLKSLLLGAVERDDKKLNSNIEGREGMWHCYEIVVTDKASMTQYVFPVNKWISIQDDIDEHSAKQVMCKNVLQSSVLQVRQLAPVKYDIVVVTGNIRSAGTDANVFVTVFGENGDSGRRQLQQAMKDLFERGQTDHFQIECLELGELEKISIEHDNSGWGAGWYLERVEIVNLASNRTWTFPCRQWLDKKKGDGQIYRELYPGN